jgi:hypothetical protein
MSRSLIPLSLALFAVALAAVPAAFARDGHHRTVLARGTCTQQSTSKLKLVREDRGIEVEFQVDQNRNGVPWKVTLRRNGTRVARLGATTHAPSGSFEIRRVVKSRPGGNRIVAVARRASTEACTAAASAPRSSAVSDDNGRDRGGDA